MKRILLITALFMALGVPLRAEWSDYGLSLVSSGPSTLEKATKFELKDKDGRVIFLNSSKEPDKAVMKRILKHRDDFYGWNNASVKELSFYLYENSIHVVFVPMSVVFKGDNLTANLPAGFSFIEEKDGLNYHYRIIVGNTSLKLDGSYSGEYPMLEEMRAYVVGIRKGKIIVEDERVVSGSVVSFADEKREGHKYVHPVGDLEVRRDGPDSIIGKIKIYASAQGSYLVPVKTFGDLFLGGYGGTLSVGLCDLGFTLRGRTLFKFDFELTCGYWHLSEQKDGGKYSSTSIKNAYVVPLGITGRYRIGVYKDFSVAPSLTFGYFYNQLQYDKFNAAGYIESVSVNEWTPSLMPGLRFEYHFDHICVFAGAYFLSMFERRLNISSLLFDAGCAYRF